jgi:hypothetical protein
MRTCAVFVLCCLVLSPFPALAQQPPTAAPPRLIISERAISEGLRSARPSPPPAQSRDDSIKNGALIGAIVGGIALGGFVGWLCNMLQEPSDPSCLPPSLLYTGVGAGIGAAAGAGLDALMFRRPGHIPIADPWKRD